MSQRRSQRLPSATQNSNSSTSSISSGRAERSTRSYHKPPSPKTSLPPRSQSLENVDDAAKPQPRRTRSTQEDNKVDVANGIGDEDEDDGEEEEVTRCICGQIEYPGLPTSTTDSVKPASKDKSDPLTSSEIMPEDAGGLFIQCDICKVWQHGGCVGILDEGMSPEEYFCEQCRKDLHKITTTPNGQKYSRYLPVQEVDSLPTSPEPSNRDSNSRKSKDAKARPSAEALAHKRRSTMNSRDAAYDEAEQLRKAIEESKKERGSVDNGSRRDKRSRSESEEGRQDNKRQRTNSGSSPSPSNVKRSLEGAESVDEADTGTKQSEGGHKKIRGAAARNHREKELRDREKEREKERADAAGRRKGRAERAERRRGDDSDPSEEPQSRTATVKGADTLIPTQPASTRPSPETPPASQDPPPAKTSHKKTGRPPARRGRVGRNQYTKDRDARLDAPNNPHTHHGSLDATEHSPRRSRSRDPVREDGPTPLLNGNGHSTWGEGGKPSKPKHMNPNRTSMNEMKRRVAGILEFIGRTQVEMAVESNKTDGEGRSPNNGGEESNGHSANGDDNGGGGRGARGGNDRSSQQRQQQQQQALVKGLMDGLGDIMDDDDGGGGGGGEKEFARLTTAAEMMDVLTRKLVRWQREYGKWGDKS